jgi:hypothetical protein
VTTGVDATAEAAAVRDGDEPSMADDEGLAGVAAALDDAARTRRCSPDPASPGRGRT